MSIISPEIQNGHRPTVMESTIPKYSFVPVEDPSLMATELASQKWLITGVSQENGLGFAIAKMAGLRGAEVFTTATLRHEDSARRAIESLYDQGVIAYWKPYDLMEEGSGMDLVDEAARTMGRLDVVVNNAGATTDKATKDVTTAEYEAALRLGLLAPFEIKRAAIQVMEDQEPWGGVIDDISSVAWRGNMWQFVYSSIKAGLIGQQMSLADEVRRRRIWCNALEVGIVPGTPLTAMLKDNLVNRFVKQAGAGPVRPEEVAQAVIITASPLRSGRITRAVLQVIGGENYDDYQIVPVAA